MKEIEANDISTIENRFSSVAAIVEKKAEEREEIATANRKPSGEL